MTAQQQAATQAMIDWLENDDGLGKRPSRIECAGQFTLNEMQYYLFRFKKSLLGKWLLGVCGGYSNAFETEHCGHVISDMQPYEPATAERQAIAMIDKLNADSKELSGLFTGFVLLNSHECDLERLKEILVQDWNISCSPEDEESEGTLVFETDGFTLAVSFIDAPVPDGEAEHYAQGNYTWREAADVVGTHVAQMIVAVFPRGRSALESGIMYTKLAASCLKLSNAIGLYSSGTVFQPEMFVEAADLLKSDEGFPVLNLVYFGLVRSEGGMSAYTCGLKPLGKDEIEIIDSQASPAELRDFLMDIASYVVEYDVALHDGETIGFTAEQKLPITRSAGVYIAGESLKIGY
ncbi:DUF4261 domain-containing protein [Cohnella phaseoli]|uniref:Uncharacterized protein DUF4261 n=1 Tax=Cohnella phaseoli TaxID=456490 RepID=A0A3D9JME8_9BACL|nr:DUF4261 domain-containing protein [Cohnella phaseoli]RED75271.1 uncharacterized protein DUF4261 [Cohnella phaseoli]